MLGLSYAIRLSPRIEKRLATLFAPSPSRVGHPGDPYRYPEQYFSDIMARRDGTGYALYHGKEGPRFGATARTSY